MFSFLSASWHSNSSCTFSALAPEWDILVSFQKEWCLQPKSVGLVCSLLLVCCCPWALWSELRNICMYIYTHIYIYTFTSVFQFLYILKTISSHQYFKFQPNTMELILVFSLSIFNPFPCFQPSFSNIEKCVLHYWTSATVCSQNPIDAPWPFPSPDVGLQQFLTSCGCCSPARTPS